MQQKMPINFWIALLFLGLGSCNNKPAGCDIVVAMHTSVANMTARPECFSDVNVRVIGYADLTQFGISIYPNRSDRELLLNANAVSISRRGNDFGGFTLTDNQIETLDVIEVYGLALSSKEIVNVTEINTLSPYD